jgi:hypothetical protein
MYIPVVKEINDLLWYLHRRNERRWLRHNLSSWARKRAMGRARFVRRTAIYWGLSQIALRMGLDYFREHEFNVLLSLIMLPLSLMFGWFVGTVAWDQNERLYKEAQQDSLSWGDQPKFE